MKNKNCALEIMSILKYYTTYESSTGGVWVMLSKMLIILKRMDAEMMKMRKTTSLSGSQSDANQTNLMGFR